MRNVDAALYDPGSSNPSIYARHCDFMWTSYPFSAKKCGEKITAEHMDAAHMFQCDLLLLRNHPQILAEKNRNV